MLTGFGIFEEKDGSNLWVIADCELHRLKAGIFIRNEQILNTRWNATNAERGFNVRIRP